MTIVPLAEGAVLEGCTTAGSPAGASTGQAASAGHVAADTTSSSQRHSVAAATCQAELYQMFHSGWCTGSCAHGGTTGTWRCGVIVALSTVVAQVWGVSYN